MTFLIKRFFLCCCIIFLLFIYSCSGSKKTSSAKSTKNTENNGFASETERLEFDFYFYNGVKEKALDNIQEATKNFRKCVEIWIKAAEFEIENKQFTKARTYL